jgi:hypothetical protein
VEALICLPISLLEGGEFILRWKAFIAQEESAYSSFGKQTFQRRNVLQNHVFVTASSADGAFEAFG